MVRWVVRAAMRPFQTPEHRSVRSDDMTHVEVAEPRQAGGQER